MKYLLLSCLLALLWSCHPIKEPIIDFSLLKFEFKVDSLDNKSLAQLVYQDQMERSSHLIDTSSTIQNDSIRRQTVYNFMKNNTLKTSNDYQNAALILQHGKDSSDFRQAVELMEKSIALNPYADKWLLAATTDRYLLSIGKKQIYGTQYQKLRNKESKWQIMDIDPTQITDAQRAEYGVETWARQQEKMRVMNLKKLSQMYASGTSIHAIQQFITSEDLFQSEYDLSAKGINAFGMELMAQEKYKEAEQILRMCTLIYFKNSTSFEALGEALYKNGKYQESLQAFQTSVHLYPNNTYPKKVIDAYHSFQIFSD
ncbi:MAG: tetratricopeptide repeat protein [Saprospiraceae bacterium]|nr:tetratricopeptide repeat protein [Saprospiraceae bacterium]